MPRFRTDKSVCRYCKQREPIVKIRKVKGLQVGECQSCNTKRQLDTRRKKRFALGLYSDTPELVSAVLKTLAGLPLGAFALISRVTKTQIGFIVVQNGALYVDTWGQCKRFAYRLFEVASVLGNQGLYIDSKPIQVSDGQGQALQTADLGQGLPLENPADSLIWFNPALLSHAVSLVQGELKEAKRNAAMIARSKNPKAKTDPKGA